MTKEQLINKTIKDNNYNSYLEIGVQFGHSINQIECDMKHGVDPKDVLRQNVKLDYFYNVTSDVFFHAYLDYNSYDCVFVDGLHECEQTLTDIVNSAAMLNYGGTIFVHDLLPKDEINQRIPRESKQWNGDCWKAWYVLLKGNYDMSMTLHNFDEGVGEIDTITDEGLDQMLCEFSDNIERMKLLTYDEHFEEYLELIK